MDKSALADLVRLKEEFLNVWKKYGNPEIILR